LKTPVDAKFNRLCIYKFGRRYGENKKKNITKAGHRHDPTRLIGDIKPIGPSNKCFITATH